MSDPLDSLDPRNTCYVKSCGSNIAIKHNLTIAKHTCPSTKCPEWPQDDGGWHRFACFDRDNNPDWWGFCPDCSSHYDREFARRELPVIEEDPEGLPL